MASLRKSDLLAVRMVPGPNWLDVVGEAWASGAAVLPVDHRLTGAEVSALLDTARPTAVLDATAGLERLSSGVPAGDEVALVVATSGTEGPPKTVELSHRAVRAAIQSSSERLECIPEDPWLCCLPLAHMGGMLVLARALLLRAPLSVHPKFDLALFENESDARFTSLVPAILFRLLEAGAQLARFKAILLGGAALSESLAQPARDAGANIVRTYGLTESCGGVVYDGIPLKGTEFRIGEEGEVQLRGPTIMRGYRLDPDASARALTKDRWLRTRDAGAIVDGRLRVHGRLDEAINTGGEKVWPGEVETAIESHPSVAEAAVGGRLDPEWGERVVAYVVPADPASPPALEEIREWVGQQLSAFKTPRELILVDSLPRTVLGKLKRENLDTFYPSN